MTDKAREDFEEKFSEKLHLRNVEFSSGMYRATEPYVYGSDSAAAKANLLFEGWLAAKEKYEPRWIPVSERLPDYDQEVIWYYEETGIIKIFSFDKDDYPIREWNFPPSHWMPLAPWSTIEPSTQGEEK